MIKYHNRKNTKIKKVWKIICMLASMGVLSVNCLCAFHMMSSLTGIYSVLDTNIVNDDSDLKSDDTIMNFEELKERDIVPFTTSIENTNNADDLIDIKTSDENENEVDDADYSIIYDEVYETDEAIKDIKKVEEAKDNEYAEDEDIDSYGSEWKWRYKLTERELNLVAAVAMLEDSEAMKAISEVILNRVESGEFEGNTVGEVIYAKGQFYVAKFIDEKSVAADEKAIEEVLAVFRDGVSVVGDAKFFAEKSVNPEKIAKGLYLIDNIGSTNFYGQK